MVKSKNKELQDPLIGSEEGSRKKEKKRSNRCSFFVVYFAIFVDMLGFGLVVPSLPDIAKDTFKATGIEFGLITASYSIAQMFGSVICGILSDRIGRRPVLIFCLMGSALSLAGMGFLVGSGNTNKWLFLAVRAADGAMSATVGIAQTYIADMTKPRERAKFMGLVGAASGLGVVAGPVLGGLLSDWKDFSFTCYVGAAISAANFLLALVLLKEPAKIVRRHSVVKEISDKPGQLSRVCQMLNKDKNIYLVFAAFMLAQFGYVAWYTVFLLYVSPKEPRSDFNWSKAKDGWVLSLFGLAMIITQILLTAPLSKTIGEKWTTVLGALARGGGLVAIVYVTSDALLIASVMLIGVSGSLISPCLSALVVNFADKQTQGIILGLNQCLGAFARATGPVAAAWLYGTKDDPDGPLWAFSFFGGSAMGLCALVLMPMKMPVRTDTSTRIRSIISSHDGAMNDEIYPYSEYQEGVNYVAAGNEYESEDDESNPKTPSTYQGQDLRDWEYNSNADTPGSSRSKGTAHKSNGRV